ncbi:MAG: AAA family ATPase [Alphaproteobacteria bacterium]|nr:AAA family ATPase [Alphaproteobacteria bacterium]MCB9793619.1 AAA family ATPase [Alphaproteobacteria bacterium]
MAIHHARVTDIGEFVRNRSCQRRFRLAYNDKALYKASIPFHDRPSHLIDPVLAQAGREREEEWAEALIDAGVEPLQDPDEDELVAMSWAAFTHALDDMVEGEACFAREVEVRGLVEGFELSGRIDFVLLLWRDGSPVLRLVECKASRRDRTYHRVQATLYRLMVLELLAARPLQVDGQAIGPAQVECVVARIDEASKSVQPILELEPFGQQKALEADVRRLLAQGGTLDQVLATPLEALPYRLESKCDDCLFSLHCLPESARQRRLELLGISPVSARALRRVGIPDMEVLADLDPESEAAAALRADPAFTEDIETLVVRARARRSTLPGERHEQDRDVLPLPYAGRGQLPLHEHEGQRLVRVYLTVSYDYVEDRVGALSAHVTTSDHEIRTPMVEQDGRWRPSPEIIEVQTQKNPESGEIRIVQQREVQGVDLVAVQAAPWTGQAERDTGAEMMLLQGFLRRLVDAIEEVAGTDEAPLHFYLWSRTEMTRLLEACSRAGSGLLHHVQELMGCREQLEQLVWSCMGEELRTRFALGWTSTGLTAACSLRWFGQRFHWTRKVGHRDEVVELDRVFKRDLFDFASTLPVRPDGSWAGASSTPGVSSRRFEVRARFNDHLSAPYWRAWWKTLPPPASYGHRHDLARAAQDYYAAAKAQLIEAYLVNRAQALRWLDERVRFRNPQIVKPPVRLSELPTFALRVDDAGQAAVDFLRLDHHVKVQDWLHAHLVPPYVRVAKGHSVPVKDVRLESLPDPKRPGKQREFMVADLDMELCPLDPRALAARSGRGTGDFVRLTRRDAEAASSQSIGDLFYGKTAAIVELDWDTGRVVLDLIPWYKRSRYLLPSMAFEPGHEEERFHPYSHATLDESVSEYIAGSVERRLLDGKGRHALDWFDPTRPRIPKQNALSPAQRAQIEGLLNSLETGPGHRLEPSRVQLLVEGLEARVQLIQGPPGTGKTQVTALAILTRALIQLPQDAVVLVTAHTHTAVDTLLARILRIRDAFADQARGAGLHLPRVQLAKLDKDEDSDLDEAIEALRSTSCLNALKKLRREGPVVIGGTVNAILKMVEKGLNRTKTYQAEPDGFLVPLLVIDEASMMVGSHFLALATLVQPDGSVLLAGDHRQLSPIVAHDWETEDRPPAQLYKPHVSAYALVDSLRAHRRIKNRQIVVHRLSRSYRLPPAIRELIRPLYDQDGITLTGQALSPPEVTAGPEQDLWAQVRGCGSRLVLIAHDDQASEQSNALEAELIRRILTAAPAPAARSVAVVTPHRAQRALLRHVLDGVPGVDLIDTVERLQGGERPLIFFSATVSDPVVIADTAEFILNINRANVAFSRTQELLVVLAGRSLLDHLPVEVEHYASALLWKHLRTLCDLELGQAQVNGVGVSVRVPGGL